MIIIKDDEKKYEQNILDHLRAHNKSHTGEKKWGVKYFYVTKNDQLLGVLKTSLGWDWVDVSQAYYSSVEVLELMLSKAAVEYKDSTSGLKMETRELDKLDDYLKIGFVKSGVMKGTSLTKDCLYANTRVFEIYSDSNLNVIQGSGVDEYNKILDKQEADYKKEHELEEKETVTYVALDGDEFLGGVQGIVTADYMYINLLVVNKDHRGKNIGTDLMNKIEEYSIINQLESIVLGTAEFQAKPFYEKLGYEVYLTMNDYPKGFECYELIKYIK